MMLLCFLMTTAKSICFMAPATSSAQERPERCGTGGIDQKIFERDADEQGLLEGSQAFKHNGRYYVMMISMDWSIPGRLRREVCYRADQITGPYEKKVI